MSGINNGDLIALQAYLSRTTSGEWIEFTDGTDTFKLFNSVGTPEASIAADIGSLCVDTAAGDLYIKTTDTVNTGWEAVNTTGGGLAWVEETTTSRALVGNEGVIGNNAATITMTLPASCAVGDVFRVTQKGAGLVRVAQNAGDTIHFGTSDTTAGAGGYLETTEQWDAIEFLCVTANTDWMVLSTTGNITIV